MSVLAETCMGKDAPGSAVYNGKNRKKIAGNKLVMADCMGQHD